MRCTLTAQLARRSNAFRPDQWHIFGVHFWVRSFPVPWAKVKTRPAPRVRLPVGFAPPSGLLKTALGRGSNRGLTSITAPSPTAHALERNPVPSLSSPASSKPVAVAEHPPGSTSVS